MNLKHLHNNSPDERYVPQHADEILIDNTIISQILTSIDLNIPLLLEGETGVGKTSVVRWLAKETNNAYRRINLNGNTTVDEFKGKLIPDEKTGKWKWVDGVLIEAMRHGHWLLLDEINAASPDVLFPLHSLLDDDGYVVIEEHNGEVVHPHKDFRLFAAMNPIHRYAGTKELNIALKSRFSIVKFNEPNAQKTLEILQHRFPKIEKKYLQILNSTAEAFNKSYNEEKSTLYCSVRDLIMALRLFEKHYKQNLEEKKNMVFLRNAFVVAALNKTSIPEEREALAQVANAFFGNMFDSSQTREKRIEIDHEELIEMLQRSINTMESVKRTLSDDSKKAVSESIDKITYVAETIFNHIKNE